MKSPPLHPEEEAFVGIYGGAFDPPHMSHVIVPGLVFGRSHATHILVVPSYTHPFAKKMTPYEDRMTMCRAAFKAYGDSLTVSMVEKEIARPNQAVYTINLLDHLAAENPSWRIRLIIGSDAYAQRKKWKAFDEIESKYRPLIIPRLGHDSPHATEGIPSPPEIASSQFRMNPESQDLQKLIPQEVLQIIEARSLYVQETQP